MTLAVFATAKTAAPRNRRFILSPGTARATLLLVIVAAVAAGTLATGAMASAEAASQAGADLSRLLRFMAALKALMASVAAAAVLWRLGAPAALPWFVAYGLACAAMGAGPGLIWSMAHVGSGALLLHGGLLACILLLWRDPVVVQRLAASVAARRMSRPMTHF